MKYILNINEFHKKPKILYHGSYNHDLTTLKPFTSKYSKIPPAIYLSSSIKVAKDYGNYIYKCLLTNFENYEEIECYGNSFHDFYEFDNHIIDAYDNGYQGIIFRNIMDSKEPNTKVPISDIYVIFNEKYVKII